MGLDLPTIGRKSRKLTHYVETTCIIYQTSNRQLARLLQFIVSFDLSLCVFLSWGWLRRGFAL
jgi:hypothetical protein